MLGDTNKRASEYRDAVESNVFNLSEAEDLDLVWEALTMQRAAIATLVLAYVGIVFPESRSAIEAAEFHQVAPAVPGQYLVMLPEDTPAESVGVLARQLTEEYGGEIKFTYTHAVKGVAVQGMTEGRARALANDPRVVGVEEAATAFSAGEQATPGWALDRIDQRKLSSLDQFYRYSAEGDGVRVYVVDTGIFAQHSEFAQHGNIQFGFDAFNTNGQPCDGHGTGVAGIIAGRTFGVAKRARVVNVKVFNCTVIGDSTPYIIKGIDWVAANAILPQSPT